MKAWINGGAIMMEGSAVLLCDTCPCVISDPCCEQVTDTVLCQAEIYPYEGGGILGYGLLTKISNYHWRGTVATYVPVTVDFYCYGEDCPGRFGAALNGDMHSQVITTGCGGDCWHAVARMFGCINPDEWPKVEWGYEGDPNWWKDTLLAFYNP